MIPSRSQIERAQKRALKRVNEARRRVSVGVNGTVSEAIQYATYQRIKQNPELEQQLRAKYGHDWKAYEKAMGELAQKFKGGFSDAN